MRASILAGVFGAGVFCGAAAMAQKQEAPGLPAERVTGIGGVFFTARDPGALGAWYRSHLGVAIQDDGYPLEGRSTHR